jgi:AcrR family transcriptional regulator
VTEVDKTTSKARRGYPEKRRAITDGARAVFGREGYTRASIDAIAAEAGVSTRTIYNHFADKSDLFLTVIEESATHVAEIQIGIIERHLAEITDLEADLIAFGCVWATPVAEFADHFALVRQINAEVGHIPAATLESWQDAGPRRVRAALARRFQELADEGYLHFDNADDAVAHFVELAAREASRRSFQGAVPLDEAEIVRLATSGVKAFLYGYLPRP